jgi:hypothetical protein
MLGEIMPPPEDTPRKPPSLKARVAELERRNAELEAKVDILIRAAAMRKAAADPAFKEQFRADFLKRIATSALPPAVVQ